MDQKTFEAILTLLVPQVIDLIVKNYGLDEISATKAFYESKLYSVLEEEDTKVWHFSPLTLFCLFDEEKRTGKITFPEEGYSGIPNSPREYSTIRHLSFEYNKMYPKRKYISSVKGVCLWSFDVADVINCISV